MAVLGYIIKGLFALCVLFLEGLSRLTGLTYVQISVVFNLWIQGAALLLASSLPMYCACARLIDNPRSCADPLVLSAVAVFVFCLLLFAWMTIHYRGAMDRAFNLCVNDLRGLSDRLGLSYYAVNLLIFVIGWLLVVGLSMFLFFKLKA